jgi:hypothetical protein
LPRIAPVAAVSFGVFTLGLDLASVPLDSITGSLGPGGQLADWVTTAVGVVPAVAVGTLLAARRPRNPIGWILLTIFLLAAAPVSDYAILDYRMHHGTLPLGWVAVTLVSAWPIFLVLIAILLWVFPDGQLPSGRWRRVSVVLVASGVVLGLAASAKGVVAIARHDVRINVSGNLTSPSTDALAVLPRVLVLGLLVSGLTWLVVQVPRYRRSGGERREQLKWLYSGAIVFVFSFFIPGQVANNLIGPFGAAALPVCIGVAVLKYKLYAIDRIVSRVISYALVTAVLAGVFAGLVLLTTHVLPGHSPVAVAASTLGAAALFNPLRKRVQRAVDRRFNRARYNAEAVVAAFTVRLRGTVDLDVVQGDLVDAVHQTFEPTHVSVWLAPTGQHQATPLGAAARQGSSLHRKCGLDDETARWAGRTVGGFIQHRYEDLAVGRSHHRDRRVRGRDAEPLPCCSRRVTVGCGW